MKKLMFALMVILMSTDALAEWVFVNGNEDFNEYVDLSTLRRTGHRAKLWTLHDNKNVQKIEGMKHLSMKVYSEFDCQDAYTRATDLVFYSQNMGLGKVINSVNKLDAEWKPVVPDSVGQSLWETACDENMGKTDWIKIDVRKDEKSALQFIRYIDPQKITKTGSNVRAWRLMVWKGAEPSFPSKNSSVKTFHEYDCKDRRTRLLEMTYFSRDMGTGTKTHETEGLYNWEPVTTGSLEETILNMTCELS